MKLSQALLPTIIAINLSGCGKSDPIAFQITINTGGKVAELVVPVEGGIYCERGLQGIPQDTEIDITSEDRLMQVKDIKNTTSWHRTPDGKYTIGKDAQGNIVFRLINTNGNGTTALRNEDELKGTMLESCSE